MKASDVAVILGISRQRVNQLIKKGSLNTTTGNPEDTDIDPASVRKRILSRHQLVSIYPVGRLEELESRIARLESLRAVRNADNITLPRAQCGLCSYTWILRSQLSTKTRCPKCHCRNGEAANLKLISS